MDAMDAMDGRTRTEHGRDTDEGGRWVGVVVYLPVVVLRPEVVEMGEGCRIDSFVKIEGGQGVVLGRGVHVASFAHLGIGGGRLVVGDWAAFSSGAKVLTGSNQMEGESMSAAAPLEMQVVARSVTVIGARAFLGTNAVVMPGVKIGEGAVIGAGAVVTKHVPPWEVWAGVPARKIGERELGGDKVMRGEGVTR